MLANNIVKTWFIAFGIAVLITVVSAWLSLRAVLAMKMNKESLFASGFYVLPYWAAIVILVIPSALIGTILAWDRIEKRAHRRILVWSDILLILAAFIGPELILKVCWK